MIRRAARQGLAAACTLVLTAAGLQVFTASAAGAAEPREVAVLPAERPLNFPTDRLLLAGASGYLHQYTNNSALLWTRYADGDTAVLDDLAIVRSWAWAGGDEFWGQHQIPGHSVPGSLTILDVGKMSWRTMTLPETGTILAVLGDTMLVRPTTGTPLQMRRYAADGSFSTVAVTGLPEGATSAHFETGDAATAVVGGTGPDGTSYGLLDLRTGSIAPVPEVTGSQTVLLSKDRVAFHACGTDSTCAVRIYSRTGLSTGDDITPETVTVPSGLSSQLVLVGDQLVGAPHAAGRTPAVNYSAPGQPEVLPKAQTDGLGFRQTGDGGLIVGGAAGDWAVRRLTAAADGSIKQSVVLDLGGRRTTAGLTISQGLVRKIQTQQLAGDDTIRHLLFSRRFDGTQVKVDGGELYAPVPCQVGQTCVRSVDSNGYGLSYLGSKSGNPVRLWQRWLNGASETSTAVGAGAVLVDVDPTYAIVNDASGQRVLRPGYSAWEPLTGPTGAGALWSGTLWTSPAAGTLRATDVATAAVTSTVTTGASCVPDEMQAALRYIYFSCGPNGPAGVFDLVRRATISLPPGRYLLGDGYVVRHDSAGRLVRHDLTTGVAGEAVVVADLPNGAVTDDRNITWAVDKYSGNIAYVDADDDVHIVDPGVPASPPAVTDRFYELGDLIYFGENGELRANWSLSRAVDSWKFTVARIATGEIVTTSTGGFQQYGIRATWDGRLASGAKAPSGRYRYTLTATTGGTTTQLDSDIVGVYCGTPRYRSYNCNGTPAVLGVFTSGEAHWLIIDHNGAIRDNGGTETWKLGSRYASETSAIVPFGDLNRDGHNDLVTRSGTGTLTVHYGISQENFGANQTKVIGAGWGGMTQIVSSGDLTGDGIPDVLGQNSAGVLRRYHGTSAGGLAGGTVVPGTWSQPKLIGPGDVNGDGKADLYAITSAGQLDVHFGTATGTFGAANRVGTGWSAYTVIGAGDLNEDNRNDLVARDGAGTFWLYPGTGSGTLGARKQLATGYQKYAGMF